MQLATIAHSPGSGWSHVPFPDLDSERTLVLVFGGSRYLDDAGALETLSAAYPKACVMGCSTSGEIFGVDVRDDSLAVAILRFDRVAVAAASARIEASSASFAAGADLARRLAGPELRGVLIFSDGLGVNGSELVAGLNSVLPPQVVVTGGLAGDGARFHRTWVLERGAPRSGVISAVGLYGEDLVIRHGSKGGWDIFGPERAVTRAEGNVLFELDGRPALQLYKEYLGDRASELPAAGLLFPLAIRADAQDDKRLVRTILAVDEAAQSMTFAGDVPPGWRAQLMRANFDRLIGGASDAAQMCAEGGAAGEATLAIAISCVGRRLVLGERIEEEVEATLEVLPAGARQVGFYSYGEISPYASGPCDLHNQTMTLTTIAERAP